MGATVPMPPHMFGLRVRFDWVCSICEAEESQFYESEDGEFWILEPGWAEVPTPQVPMRWSLVQGMPVCPAHEVTVAEKEA